MEANRDVRRRGSLIYLDIRLRVGGVLFRLNIRPPLTPKKIPDTHFC
jgi:hypothetical protein